MSPVLVTDGDHRAALAVVRSLGRRGEEVHVCSETGRSIGGASRHCRSEIRVPGPTADPEAHFRALREALRASGADTLLPITEASLRSVLPRVEAMKGVRVPFPGASTFARISDKGRLLASARKLGIRTPAQRLIPTPLEGERALLHGDLPPFPVALKPSRSVLPSGREAPGVRYAGDRLELIHALMGTPAEAYPLLMQERIVGPGTGVFLLLWEGRVRASFVHRRIREKPPTGGVSVCRESGEPDPALLDASRRLLESAGWRGVAMVEYKIDRTTGEPVLMEVNGRFWGSLQLAVDAGVDFPALLLDAARGEPLPPSPPSWTKVRSRWLWGEVDHLLARLRAPENGPWRHRGPLRGRLQALLELLRWSPRDRTEVLRISDPLPFLRESARWIRNAVGAGEPERPGAPMTPKAPAGDADGPPSRAGVGST